MIARSKVMCLVYPLVLLLQAIELRARCGCPGLSDPDPRAVFSKAAQLMLKNAEQEKYKAKELKEREQAARRQQSGQPQLGAALALSAQQHPLFSKEALTEVRLMCKEVVQK